MTRRTWLISAISGLLAGCRKEEAKPSAPVQRYDMRGEVLRIDAGNRTAVIRHEEIAGWMEAMTMEFPVREESEFRKLQPGARIRAIVMVQDLDYWLEEIRPE